MQTPWERARKIRSSQQEERLGQMPAGTRQPGSGRFWKFHRDGIVWNFLVEARTTQAGSYSVSEKEFQQIRKEAITTPPGLKPAMQIDVGETQLWLMELRDWEMIYVRLMELESRYGDGA